MHNGKGRFYVGYGVKQVFIVQNVTHSGSVNTTTGEVTLTRTAGGACGIHASTTLGYSNIIFGLFGLLGYQFSPRLADIGGTRFWRLDPEADYEPYQS